MNSLDEQVQAVIAIIEAAGGRAGIAAGATDEVKRAYLNMILGCRECRDAIPRQRDAFAS